MGTPQQLKPVRVWTLQKQNELDTMYCTWKLPVVEIAERMNLTVSAIRERIKKLGMTRNG